jgi:hypothetical protein
MLHDIVIDTTLLETNSCNKDIIVHQRSARQIGLSVYGGNYVGTQGGTINEYIEQNRSRKTLANNAWSMKDGQLLVGNHPRPVNPVYAT